MALNLSDNISGTKQLRLKHLINHPGRKQSLQYFDYHYGAATPPSKGGETFPYLSI